MTGRLSLAMPVRFAVSGLVVQSVSRELSKSGVFIRCLVCPAVGTKVALRLYLPGSVAPEVVVAFVRETEQNPAGFWAEFVRANTGFVERITRALEDVRQPPPPPLELDANALAGPSRELRDPALPAPTVDAAVVPDPDRRRHSRYACALRVRFPTARAFLIEHADSISAGGIFVPMRRPPATGALVQISIELPDGGPPAVTGAKVVTSTSEEEAASTGKRMGAGLQFHEASETFQERLDLCLATLAAADVTP